MIRKIGEKSSESWVKRASAPVEPAAKADAATASAPVALTDRSQGGWDPMEVWLRYIDQPRRMRQRAASTDPRRRD